MRAAATAWVWLSRFMDCLRSGAGTIARIFKRLQVGWLVMADAIVEAEHTPAIRILIADASLFRRRLTAEMLRAGGRVRIDYADTVAECLGLLPYCQPNLLIADWDLDRGAGLDLVRRIRGGAGKGRNRSGSPRTRAGAPAPRAPVQSPSRSKMAAAGIRRCPNCAPAPRRSCGCGR